MKILTVNGGSSSLKFNVIELPEEKELISGYFEKIGLEGSFYNIKINGEKIKREVELKNHMDAVNYLNKELIDNNIVASLDEIDGVGHRIVHGGSKFNKSVLITDEVIKELDEVVDLAPLHNPPMVECIKAFRSALPNTPMVVVFDTAFHQSMNEEEYLYPVPYEWYTKYAVRKYGFHGTSHRFIAKSAKELLGRDDLKIISCHVGSGASCCAIDGDKVVDTSMGFTPLAGVMMGTRSGDVDPSIIPYIMKKEGKTCEEVINDLNKNSGLLGVSGVSNDSRDIEDGIAAGNKRCELAQNIFCKKVANYIAMYNNELNGADVIVLTAGLGENSADTRAGILKNITSLGVKLDESVNDFRGELRKISTEDSKIPVYVIPTNEELMIALDTYEIINNK